MTLTLEYESAAGRGWKHPRARLTGAFGKRNFLEAFYFLALRAPVGARYATPGNVRSTMKAGAKSKSFGGLRDSAAGGKRAEPYGWIK
jgi:hypothetical protein